MAKMKANKKPPVKRVTRRRTPTEVAAAVAKDQEFRRGFALSLILLFQGYGQDSAAGLGEIIFYTLEEAGFSLHDFDDIEFDDQDQKTLNFIFGV